MIQKDLFFNILTSLWIPHVSEISGVIERKMVAIAMTKILVEPKCLVPPYIQEWGKILASLLGLLENVESVDNNNNNTSEEDEIEIEEISGYSTFSRLNYASKENQDPFKDIPNGKHYLALSLSTISKQAPGKFPAMISSAIPPEAQQVLFGYFKTTPNITEPFLV